MVLKVAMDNKCLGVISGQLLKLLNTNMDIAFISAWLSHFHINFHYQKYQLIQRVRKDLKIIS